MEDLYMLLLQYLQVEDLVNMVMQLVRVCPHCGYAHDNVCLEHHLFTMNSTKITDEFYDMCLNFCNCCHLEKPWHGCRQGKVMELVKQFNSSNIVSQIGVFNACNAFNGHNGRSCDRHD